MSASSMPLHLLPPHIKLQILNSLNTQPTQTQPRANTNNDSVSAASSSSSTTATLTSNSSSTNSTTSAHFTTAPLFTLSSLTSTTPLPPPFTLTTLAHLHTHHYCIIDSFLPPLSTPTSPLHSLHSDIAHLLATNSFTPGGMHAVDTWQAADVRGDKVCWLSTDRTLPPSVSHVLTTLHAAVQSLAVVLQGWPCVASSSQLALYEAGGRYVRHLDVRRGGGGPVRRLTAIVYLNDGWQAEWGGQLRLYEQCSADVGESERSVDVLPVYGRLLLFASEELEHEVLPATHRRVALTTWFK